MNEARLQATATAEGSAQATRMSNEVRELAARAALLTLPFAGSPELLRAAELLADAAEELHDAARDLFREASRLQGEASADERARARQ